MPIPNTKTTKKPQNLLMVPKTSYAKTNPTTTIIKRPEDKGVFTGLTEKQADSLLALYASWKGFMPMAIAKAVVLGKIKLDDTTQSIGNLTRGGFAINKEERRRLTHENSVADLKLSIITTRLRSTNNTLLGGGYDNAIEANNQVKDLNKILASKKLPTVKLLDDLIKLYDNLIQRNNDWLEYGAKHHSMGTYDDDPKIFKNKTKIEELKQDTKDILEKVKKTEEIDSKAFSECEKYLDIRIEKEGEIYNLKKQLGIVDDNKPTQAFQLTLKN